jgi:hypothetical protein
LVTIRKATEQDLERILKLGEFFGHLMFYQKDIDIMRKLLPDIIVAEETRSGWTAVEGYYHAIEMVSPKNYDDIYDPNSEFLAKIGMLTHYKCLHRDVIDEICYKVGDGQKILVIFQGGCHRDLFKTMIQHYIDKNYDEMFVYCSKTSGKAKGYEELGFTFSPEEVFTFWNPHKCGVSTYRLGIRKSTNVPAGSSKDSSPEFSVPDLRD